MKLILKIFRITQDIIFEEFRNNSLYNFLRRLYFRHFIKYFRNRNVVITCTGKSDGGGAQIHANISVMILAEYYGFNFVYTPLETIEHCPFNMSNIEFVERWNSKYGFGEIFRNPYPNNKFIHFENLTLLMKFIKDKGSKDVLFVSIQHAHLFSELNLEMYKLIFQKYNLKKLYSFEKDFKNSKNFKIFSHLRRGDVKENDDRYTNFYNLKEIINYYLYIYKKTDPEVKIFTNDLELNIKENNFFIDNKSNVFELLDQLISADIFIMAKSSLSYLAALYNQNIVVYNSFWHGKLNSWSKY